MRKCAFCPAKNLTNEHVWSDWINAILPETRYNFQLKKRDGSHNRFQLPELGYKTHIACRKCNSEWMSDLETEEAKPSMADMIRYGGAVSLLPRGIASIAAFAFKTAIVSNSSGFYSNKPFFTIRQRYHFRRTLEVPAGVHIWLFSVNTPVGISGKLNSYFGSITNVNNGLKLYACTFAIGFLGFQLVALKWFNPRLRNRVTLPWIRQDNRFDNVSVPVFPSDGLPVIWPPRDHIHHNAINEFCHRWKDFDYSRLTI